MTRYLFASVLFTFGGASALADPFDKGDTNIGKALVDRHCTSCHVSQFGGDGSAIFTRPDRKIRTAEQLVQQIRHCNEASSAGLSAQGQQHVGAYLNQAYYGFK
jgi:mono/diheme cytochrome c family protein